MHVVENKHILELKADICNLHSRGKRLKEYSSKYRKFSVEKTVTELRAVKQSALMTLNF